jgi:hypothetical protein
MEKMLNSCNANDQRVSLELLGADSVRNKRGLWSEYTCTWGEPNNHALYLLRAQITANAYFSIVDQALA